MEKVRMSQRQLRGLIRESVRGVLSEISAQVASSAARKAGNGGISDFYEVDNLEKEKGNGLGEAFGLIRSFLEYYNSDVYRGLYAKRNEAMECISKLEEIKDFIMRKGNQMLNLGDMAENKKDEARKRLDSVCRQMYGVGYEDLTDEQWDEFLERIKGDDELYWIADNLY